MPWWTAWADRAYRACSAVRDEVSLSRSSPDAWARIVAERYGRHAAYYDRPQPGDRELLDWERMAIDDFFPPPACLLVGGAGAGREMLALAALGYRVAGFEPAAPLHAVLLRRLRDAAVTPVAVAQGGYEALVDGGGPTKRCSPGDGDLTAIVRAAPYDGVILGLGSIGCIASGEAREALLPAVATLCPRGPVLLSFAAHTPGQGRTGRLAALSRSLLGRLPGAHPVAPGDRLDWFGFEHVFADDEIETLAKKAGYRVARLAHEPYAHGVLVRDG